MEKNVVLFFLFVHVARTIAMRSIQISQDDVVDTNAKNGAFPFMISLQQYFPSNYTMIHKCGGVIIGPDYALTADSCSSNSGINTASRVISGSVDLASGGFLHRIIRTFIYRNYHNKDTPDYNLAVIKVTPPFDFSLPGVKAIQMVESYEDDAQFVSIGWGAIKVEYGHNPKVLQVKRSKLASREYCDSFYIRIESQEICTQNHVGEGLCRGDEGGPLVFVSKTNGTMFLVGIVTKEHYCGSGYPDIYAKVWQFRAWINFVTNNKLNL